MDSDDGHPEAPGPFGDSQADLAHTDNAHCPSKEAFCAAIRLLVPETVSQVARGVGDVAVDCQQQPEGELGNCDGVRTGDVADVDAGVSGCLAVNGVGAGTGPDHKPQVPGLVDRVRSYLGTADYEDVGVLDRIGEVAASQLRSNDAVVASFPQAVNECLG